MTGINGGSWSARLLTGLLALLGLALILIPLVGLIAGAPWSDAWTWLSSPAALDAIKLSLLTSILATAGVAILGLPLAWVLARAHFPGRSLLRGLVILPLLMPPVASGTGLSLAFQRHGIAGQPLGDWLGIHLPLTTAAVVLAQAFVALPFLILAVDGGLRAFDERLEEVGRALGGRRWTVFRQITLPLLSPTLVAGVVLAWSRALGEFGATIVFAGSRPGVSQTMPVAVYALQRSAPQVAAMLSVVLVAVSALLLVGLRRYWLRGLDRGRQRR
jgi:molybdate transport system permease protein